MTLSAPHAKPPAPTTVSTPMPSIGVDIQILSRTCSMSSRRMPGGLPFRSKHPSEVKPHPRRMVARQQTLAHLLRQFNAQHVRDDIVDTQASAREQVQTRHEGRKITRSDLPDIRTYRNLVRKNAISPRMRVLHVDDHHQPGLWLADATAWAFQRALHRDEPHWWNRISGVATVTDAIPPWRAAPAQRGGDRRDLRRRRRPPLIRRDRGMGGRCARRDAPGPGHRH